MSYRSGMRNSFGGSGTLYGRGSSNYVIRRHVSDRTFSLAPNKAFMIPLLAYHKTEPAKTSVTGYDDEAVDVYKTVNVQDGSTVRRVFLDMLIKPSVPSDVDVIDFYVAWIATSFTISRLKNAVVSVWMMTMNLTRVLKNSPR